MGQPWSSCAHLDQPLDGRTIFFPAQGSSLLEPSPLKNALHCRVHLPLLVVPYHNTTGWMASGSKGETSESKASAGPCFLAASRRGSIHASFSFWKPQASLGLWWHRPSLGLCLHIAPVDQVEAVKQAKVIGFYQGTALGWEEDGPVSCHLEVAIWEPQGGQKLKSRSELHEERRIIKAKPTSLHNLF